MQRFGIEFVAGHYFYGTYRYDCLSDACAFARLAPGHEVCQHSVQIAHAAQHLNLRQERRMIDGKGKALKTRPGGRIGHYYIFPENAPTSQAFKRSLLDLMDSILQWDTDHEFLQLDAPPETDRFAQAIAFFELNHITNMRVKSLDDQIDSSSDA